jgi:nicotinamide phosphoribosyltransferase
MSISKSILFNVDSYKVSMHCQMPPGTTGVYSYIESRGGEYDRTVFFGLQAFIKEYLTVPITQDEINLADEILTAHGEPFNRAGWQHILDQHGGYLPVVIRAVPEGTVVPTKNVLATIENTDPQVPWLTTWLETALLRAVWYPTTVATRSWHIRQTILKYLEETGDPSGIDFKLHDFSARGVSSFETAGIGGAAHLVNFMGTDTVSGVMYAREYYGAGVAGFSIPASEHSISCSYGRNEKQYVLNMIAQFAKPGSIFAMVADSYDVFKFCEMVGTDPEIKAKIEAHGATGGLVVIRPDSGDPVEVNRQLIKILGEKFGYTVNTKGYKVLKHVRIIQGDGVNETSILAILEMLKDGGWSVDNMAFGMGAELGQKVNRDTLKFAQKASAVCINGEWVPISKDPVTDPGKRSKTGRVTLYRNHDGSYHSGVEDWPQSALETVYENGRLIRDMTFEQVRKNARG